MKKKTFLTVFGILICLPSMVISAETIAVLDFVVEDDIERVYAESLANQVRVEVLKRDDLTLLDRQSIESIIEEQKLQSSGLLAEATAVRIGEIAGASLIVNGSIGKSDESYVVSIRLIDVETSEILKLMIETVKESGNALQNAVTDMSQEMFGTYAVLPRGQIIGRSALLPGLGQRAAGNTTKGTLYGAIFGSLAVSTSALGYLSYSSYKTYQETEGYGENYDALWNRARAFRISFITSASLTGAFYLFNIVDAAYLTGRTGDDE